MMRPLQNAAVATAALGCPLAMILVNTQTAIAYEAVTRSGHPAPGMDPGVTYRSFTTPVINQNGQTAFRALVQGPGIDVNNWYGLWSEAGGSLDLVIQRLDPVPGEDPGVYFHLLSVPGINTIGQTLVASTIEGTGIGLSGEDGLWVSQNGTLSPSIREGDPAPDVGQGVTFRGFYFNPPYHDTVLNASGHTAFEALLEGPGVDNSNATGIWSGAPGSLNLVARRGDHAPGTEPGAVFGGAFGDPLLNDAGQTAFLSYLDGAGVDNTNNLGIWVDTRLVARSGDHAPDTDSGVVFGNQDPFGGGIGFHTFNARGQVALRGTLVGPGVSDANDSGIWSESAGTLNLIARENEPAPGTDTGVLFDDFSGAPILDGTGRTGFLASLTGPGVDETNDTGMWIHQDGQLKLVIREGDPAPGMAPGVDFGQVIFSPTLNTSGNIAFEAVLAGAGVDANNNESIWATGTNGKLSLVVREGELGVGRTVNMVNGRTGEDGRATSLNNAGQLTFELSFTDGSEGIFIANLGLPGDLNGDGFVGINDLNIVLGNWNQNVPPADQLADPSGDGFVGIDDLNAVLGNWNAGTPPTESANIPEPASVSLLVLGTVLLMRRSD